MSPMRHCGWRIGRGTSGTGRSQAEQSVRSLRDGTRKPTCSQASRMVISGLSYCTVGRGSFSAVLAAREARSCTTTSRFCDCKRTIHHALPRGSHACFHTSLIMHRRTNHHKGVVLAHLTELCHILPIWNSGQRKGAEGLEHAMAPGTVSQPIGIICFGGLARSSLSFQL